jgi:hypothetical protein
VKADPIFNYLENIRVPLKYVQFTDRIVDRIRRSKNPILKESKDILGRIDTGNLYQYVAEFFL